ncbi:MAG: DNA-binding protein AraC-type [Clostridia bacterium]|jgi:AraC-like DNA-binding protein/ligand-binding sensor protein|nr:DNA-binding protein AraC-type [Clostridia bacterium]
MDKNLISHLPEDLNKNKAKLIESYVEKLESTFNIKINIHDVAGISSLAPSLEKVILSHQYHNNAFCNHIKKNDHCLKLCILNKEKLCHRCQKLASPFYNSCYMGVEEFVFPVMCDSKLIAVLCVGQFYSDLDLSKKSLADRAELYKLSFMETEKSFFSVARPIDFDMETLNCYISMLADNLCLTFKEALEKGNPNKSLDLLDLHKNNFIINNTVQFIKDNYSSSLSLDLLASNSYCNTTYLSHLFKEKMDCSITEYINNIRIQRAKELLDLTPKTITEIGLKVGFNDLGYFGRVFKHFIGLTPKEYRERNT